MNEKHIKKYEFTGETIAWRGKTLHRIRRILDGKLGGFIESESNLSHEGSCWIDEEAVVWGNAIVQDNAKIYDWAEVSGNAIIKENSKVMNEAKVSGNAVIKGNTQVCGRSEVFGEAILDGNTKVYYNSRIG